MKQKSSKVSDRKKTTDLKSEILVHCAHDKLVDITELVPHPRNPNKHPDSQVALLAKIIRAQGWRAPITVSERSGFIIKGHGRLQAAQLLGMQVVPVDVQPYETEAAEWQDMIADNRIAELAEMDLASIKDLLQEMDTGENDMDLTGYDEMELERLMTQFHVKGENDANSEWSGMPEFSQEDQSGMILIVHFKTTEDKMLLAQKIEQPITEATRSIWFPHVAPENLKNFKS